MLSLICQTGVEYDILAFNPVRGAEQITRASYVVSAELVDPVTAEIIDEAFSEPL